MSLLNKYPNFQKDTFINIQPNEYILNQIQLENIVSSYKYDISLNEDAFNIIKRFDGKRKLSEILEYLQVQKKEDISKIVDFIIALSNQIEIVFSKKTSSSNLELYGDSKTFLPSVVSLTLTNKCNFKCSYCYNSSSPSNNSFLEKPIELLEQLKKLGVKVIELTGGEPFLHPEIKNIIEYVVDNFQILAILTNGYNINKEILQKLGEHKNKVVMQISLDGSYEKLVDEITLIPGSFNKICNNIKLVANHGLNIRAAMAICSREQIYDMEKTLRLAKKLGCRWFGITHVIQQGRAKNKDITKNGLLLTETVEKLSKKYPKFFISKAVEYLPIKESDFKKTEHCGTGRRAIAISAKNRIMPCSLSEENLEIFGHVPNDNLINLFNSNDYKAFSTLNSPRIETCKSCEHIVFCLGCIVRGFAKANEIGHPNCNWVISESTCEDKSVLIAKIKG